MKNSVVTTKRKSSSGRSMESSVGATICVTRVTLQKTIKKQTKVIIEIKKLEKIAPSKLGKMAGKIFEIWRHWFSFASGIEMAPNLLIFGIKK